MTQPDGLFPTVAANFGSLADFASKTQSDWESSLVGAETDRWSELLSGLFGNMPSGQSFIMTLITELSKSLLRLDPTTFFATIEDAWNSLTGLFTLVQNFLNAVGNALGVSGSTLSATDIITAFTNLFAAFGSATSLTGVESFISGIFSSTGTLGTAINQIGDIVNGLVVTPINTAISDFKTWFASLTSYQATTTTAVSTAQTDISGTIAAITAPITGTVGTVVADVENAVGSLLDGLRQAADGTTQTGATSTAAADALSGVVGAVSSVSQQVSDLLVRLQPRPPATSVGGAAPAPTTGWGAGWTLTGATTAATVDANGYDWIDSGSSARSLIGINSTPTSTDYQSVRLLLQTMMESPLLGSSPNCGNALIARADATSSPANYVYCRFYYNQIVLGCVVSGTNHTLTTWSVAPANGQTYELLCGNASGTRYFQLFANGKAVADPFFDSGSVSQVGSGFRYGGQAMYSDNRGVGESSPGAVGYWKLSDKAPSAKVGSGFKVCRISTTGVSFAANTAVIPASFYDTVDKITDDFSWDTTTTTMTVRDEGWYQFSIALPLLASNGTYNTPTSSKPMSVALSVDGVLDSIANTGSITTPGAWATFPPVYCLAGSEVSPVYSCAAANTISGGYGTQTTFERTAQWFAGTKLGQLPS